MSRSSLAGDANQAVDVIVNRTGNSAGVRVSSLLFELAHCLRSLAPNRAAKCQSGRTLLCRESHRSILILNFHGYGQTSLPQRVPSCDGRGRKRNKLNAAFYVRLK